MPSIVNRIIVLALAAFLPAVPMFAASAADEEPPADEMPPEERSTVVAQQTLPISGDAAFVDPVFGIALLVDVLEVRYDEHVESLFIDLEWTCTSFQHCDLEGYVLDRYENERAHFVGDSPRQVYIEHPEPGNFTVELLSAYHPGELYGFVPSAGVLYDGTATFTWKDDTLS